jgi:hypothetical protein
MLPGKVSLSIALLRIFTTEISEKNKQDRQDGKDKKTKRFFISCDPVNPVKFLSPW